MVKWKKILVILNSSLLSFLILIGIIYYYFYTTNITFVKPNIIKYSFIKSDTTAFATNKITIYPNNNSCKVIQNIVINNKKKQIKLLIPFNFKEINHFSVNGHKTIYSISNDTLSFFSKDTILKISVNFTLFLDGKNFQNVVQKDFYKIENYYMKNIHNVDENYHIKVVTEPKYLCFSNLSLSKYKVENNKASFYFIGNTSNDNIIFLSRNILALNDSIEIDNKKLYINYFIQEQNKKYINEIKNCVKNYYKLANRYLDLPGSNIINIADLPITTNLKDKYYNLINLQLQQYNYTTIYKLKENIIEQLTSQYFCYYIHKSNLKEWKTYGLTKFIANHIKLKLLGKPKEKIDLFSILEVNGINYLSFLHIPLIYTLGDYDKNYYSNSLVNYFKSDNIFNIQDSIAKINDPKINNYIYSILPELFFETIYNYIGDGLFVKIKKQYQYDLQPNNYTYNLLNEIYYEYPYLRKSIETVFYENLPSNYRIKNLKKESPTTYTFIVENVGNAIFPVDLKYITIKNDTFNIPYNYKKKWSYIKIFLKDELFAIVIDPKRKNILDKNYSDNSYTIENKLVGSFTLASRLFFYLENFLIVIGSL